MWIITIILLLSAIIWVKKRAKQIKHQHPRYIPSLASGGNAVSCIQQVGMGYPAGDGAVCNWGDNSTNYDDSNDNNIIGKTYWGTKVIKTQYQDNKNV